MSARLHNFIRYDTSHRHRDATFRHSRETVGSSAIATPQLPVTARGAHPAPHVENETGQSRTISDSQLPRIAQERVDVTQRPEQRGISTSLSKDHGSFYSGVGEETNINDEPRPLKNEDQRRYDGDRTDDRRDILRVTPHPSLKENYDIHRPPTAHIRSVEPTVPASTSFEQLYEEQSRELLALQHDRRVVHEEKKRLSEANAALKYRYEDRSKKLSVALEKKKQADDAHAALKLRYAEQAEKLNAIDQEHQSTLQRKQEEFTSLRKKYDAQKNEYNALSNKYHSLKATLEQRTSELHGVQKFLTTADTFSGAEVINALRNLNEEVQQSTTYMVEWAVEHFAFETPRTEQPAEEVVEQTRTSESLGVKLMQLLRTRDHRDNPILVEMALRAHLIYSLYWVASPWSMGQEEQSHNVYIDAIYQRMRESEGQAISGNWRALTRAYTLPACMGDPELAHNIDTTIMSGFSDILVAAGCTASTTDITSVLWTKFAEKVHHFVSLAGQVNKMIGVGVISEDFEVLVVWPDTPFDDKQMEDSYDSGERVQGAGGHQEDVLCATDLGVMQRINVGAGAGEEGEPSELIVVKPRVALMSVLNIIDE